MIRYIDTPRKQHDLKVVQVLTKRERLHFFMPNTLIPYVSCTRSITFILFHTWLDFLQGNNLFESLLHCSPLAVNKGVNTVLEAVLVWPAVRYISDICQYRCTVSGLPLFFIFINKYIYIYICMCMCVCIYIIINIKIYRKTFPQFRTNYSWF